MKARYVNELAEGTQVDAAFVIRSKESRTTRSGEMYLSLEVADRTGTIPVVAFRPQAAALSAPVGAVVAIRGNVTRFKGIRRITADSVQPAEKWDRSDFVAEGRRPASEVEAEFIGIVRSISNPELRRVLRAVFSDGEFMRRFKSHPASQSHHHAYIGGLIEHTTTVAGMCLQLAERYEGIDVDLLVAAALLHDVGKVDELVVDTSISYSDEGRLLGHVVLGHRRVATAIAQTGADARLAMRLEHALLSHHGELEWGSPKRPSTLEALVLHHADNLDAKASGFSALLHNASAADETWTDSQNLFRRPLYAPRPVEDDRPHLASEDEDVLRRSA